MAFKTILSGRFEYAVPHIPKLSKEGEEKVEYADGSVYHRANRLNDLTNKEWLKFQKSWFVLNPSPRKGDVLLHPAKFPEELVSDFVRFFTKKGEVVLDPMVGTGSTLIGAMQVGRSCIGIELQEKYAQIARKRVEQMISQHTSSRSAGVRPQNCSVRLIVGDALGLDQMHLPPIDYCITSPPYWDMLTEKGFETQQHRKERGLDVHYSDNPRDLGNIHDYAKFVDELVRIYMKVFDVLEKGRYVTIIVKNIKKKSKVYPLAWDLAKRLGDVHILKDEKIWCQDDVKLAPYGYRYSWVSNTVHHYCLNFQKS